MKKEDYYIDLILEKCVSFKHSKSLFISYNSYNEGFIQKLLKKLENTKINDIYLECIDPFYEHDLLANSTCEQIEESKYFDSSIYDEYAKKKAAFLMFVSPIPGLMNDIDDEKLALVSKIKSSTKKYFVELETNYKISWSILPLYNEYWEKELGINNLEDILYKICKVDKKASLNWTDQIERSKSFINKINKLNLDYIVLENGLGTNLKLGLPKNYKFEGVGETEVLVNMPSYEIFTSPDCTKAEGTVYSSRPLYYNGAVIDDFYLEFKDGKVIKYGAKKGKKILQSIIEYDEGSSRLGELAFVESDSPISKTNIVFKTTLLDENASCHLALGRGFGNGTKINKSQIHVDFMFGTDDLKVTGTKDNEEIPIMENGKFII
ncbi:MAG: aminopeptidase [Bacilli bacterium]|nr:aminopeptidase [Bacilli bacterium]